jgi:dihydrofolate reductase
VIGVPWPEAGGALPFTTEDTMRKVKVFNQISVDGYFTDEKRDMSWAHKQDAEWNAFTADNAKGGGVLVFGRITYEMMAAFWPTPEALKVNATVAEQMNSRPKIVFSRTLAKATWNNTRLIKDDLVGSMRQLKAESGPDLVIMGSGTIVSQLTEARLVDEYQVVVNALVLGHGRTMFEGVTGRLPLVLKKSRQFQNGNLVLWYEPAPAS